jgi:hypothetical protein
LFVLHEVYHRFGKFIHVHAFCAPTIPVAGEID